MIIVVIMLTLMMDEALLDMFSTLVHRPLHGAHKSKLGITSFGIKYKRGDDMRLMGYSDHNVDIDNGQSTTGHVFYFGTSPITWSSQNQNTVVLSLCEAKVIADTVAVSSNLAKGLLVEVIENEQLPKIIDEWEEESDDDDDDLITEDEFRHPCNRYHQNIIVYHSTFDLNAIFVKAKSANMR
ncbi:uncharacterized mitochondrial protein-like protein [Tanacetum coccineum]